MGIKIDEIIVSDHAIERYARRVEGRRIDPRDPSVSFDIARKMMDTVDIAGAAAVGATTVKSGGMRYIIKNGVVVSVVPA